MLTFLSIKYLHNSTAPTEAAELNAREKSLFLSSSFSLLRMISVIVLTPSKLSYLHAFLKSLK